VAGPGGELGGEPCPALFDLLQRLVQLAQPGVQRVELLVKLGEPAGAGALPGGRADVGGLRFGHPAMREAQSPAAVHTKGRRVVERLLTAVRDRSEQPLGPVRGDGGVGFDDQHIAQ